LNAVGAGCEPNCKWTCLSSDPARGCAGGDTCTAAGTCDDATHTCKPGGPKPTGATCGPSKYCRGPDCVDSKCGDAVASSPEDCDNGFANGPGTGCEANCTFSCNTNPQGCPTLPCNVPACTAKHRCGTAPDPSKNGQGCGAGLVCKSGACIDPNATCGNGIKENGEDCDFGAGNGPDTGCETICKFSCSMGAACPNDNACVGAPTCTAVTVDGKTGQKCAPGPASAD